MTTFKDFSLRPELQKVLEDMNFTQPTEIQSKSVPLLLGQDRIDFLGQAQTGTGKTLAFGLPLLQRVTGSNNRTQALIVAPTRELALQICDSLKPFARSIGVSITPIYGGASMEEQIRSLKRGTQVVVGTPGRLNDHLRRKTLDLSTISTLVLDEADIMLDMGFKDEVDEILEHMPAHRNIWLFSATIKSGISTIMREHMRDTQTVKVATKVNEVPSTEQYYCVVPMRQRLQALCRFIESAPDFYGFIFCQTKILTSEIAEQLIRLGYNVGALHGDLSQAQRNLVVKKFKNRDISIVVATDVAARGIDIANLTHVVNYSIPEDLEGYVHRIGRTGRAGKKGIAISFVGKSETRDIAHIQKKFNFNIQPIDVPSKEQIAGSRVVLAQKYLEQLSELSYKPQQALVDLVNQFSPEQVRELLEKSLYDKFIRTIDQEEDLSFGSTPREMGSGGGSRSGVQEFSLAVGLDDNVTREEVVAYLLETNTVKEDQILKVRVIKRKTFIEVPSDVAPALLQALANTSLAGRKTRAQLVEAEDQSRRGGDRDGGDDRGERRGGYHHRRPMGRARGGNFRRRF